jgi:beta-aspartyl-peptidase (threonine type)
VARYIAALVEAGAGVGDAAQQALDQVAGVGGEGGLIAVDAGGEVTLPYLTAAMPRGMWRAGEEPVAWIGAG